MLDPDKVGTVFSKHQPFALPELEKLAQEKEKTCEHCAHWGCFGFTRHTSTGMLQVYKTFAGHCKKEINQAGNSWNGEAITLSAFGCREWESK